MSLFLGYNVDEYVQVKDKFRFNLSSSFSHGTSITDVTVVPEVGESPLSIYNPNPDKWVLDWAYKTAGDKVATLEITDGVETDTITVNITSVTEQDDNLYSNDNQIFKLESELKRYLPVGRNSYKYAHRIAQERMLSFLDRKRIYNQDGSPLTKAQINLQEDVVKWSVYETILVIYEDLVLSVGDKFREKINYYEKLRNYERERSQLRIDKDNSGTIDKGEIQDLKSFRMIIR